MHGLALVATKNARAVGCDDDPMKDLPTSQPRRGDLTLVGRRGDPVDGGLRPDVFT
ncbi:MAG TPA: hypothetical protein VFQ77_15465 [Pseudonocardiaceae bacterium]|nr:hypothetical protein [Pseudonocardiaceae bacterium]